MVPLRRWWPVGVVLLVLISGLGWATGHLAATLEIAAVATVALVVVGVLRHRPQPRSGGVTADPTLLAAVRSVLDGLDPIEHRSVRLDALWPQVTVGPTGVVIVDVCELQGPLRLDGDTLRARRGGAVSRRAARVAELATRLRAELVIAELATPVRAVLVVRDDADLPASAGSTEVAIDEGPVVVRLVPVTVERLAATIARGEVLPMSQVERTFHALAATVVTQGR